VDFVVRACGAAGLGGDFVNLGDGFPIRAGVALGRGRVLLARARVLRSVRQQACKCVCFARLGHVFDE
jgi:hypothetical protein